MTKFDKDSFVTALPCESRHYFHSECLEDWVKQTTFASCPICPLVEISVEEIENVTKVYRKKLL